MHSMQAAGIVTEILEPAADPRIAPRSVLRRHADRQRGEVRLGARATRASRLRAIVFLRHERPIPPRDRVWRHDADDARKPTAAEGVCFHGQAAALVVGEAKPSASVRCTQDAVLLEQVLNDRLLPPVDPAGEDENDEGKRRRQRVHGRKRARQTGIAQDASDFAIVRHAFGPSFRGTSLLRFASNTVLSSDPASAEFSHRTGYIRADGSSPMMVACGSRADDTFADRRSSTIDPIAARRRAEET
jgi:hypothetical protein